jgi:hypothetical protein
MNCCQLEEIIRCAPYAHLFRGVHPANYNSSLEDGFYIFNTVSDEQLGHWVALSKRKNNVIYFDSFGLPPIELVKLLTPYNVSYNPTMIQESNSMQCGLYVLLFMHYQYLNLYNQFINIFHNDTRVNECIVSDLSVLIKYIKFYIMCLN